MAVPYLDGVMSGKPLGTAPVLILGSALGSTLHIWDEAASHLEAEYTIIRFDLPGHGLTPRATSGFSIDDLSDGIVQLADRLGVTTFFFAGVSIGGALALVLARRHPERILGIAVVCSAATFGGQASGFLERAAHVRAEGMGFVTPAIPGRWFAESYIAANPDVVERIVAMVDSADPEGYAQCCEALATYDETSRLASVRVPVVVVSGESDPGSPPEAGARVADGVAHGHQIVIPDTSHMAVVERPEAVAKALLETFRV